jgi:Mn2+/Fe2+ NRAMP family transporter
MAARMGVVTGKGLADLIRVSCATLLEEVGWCD